MSFEQKLAVIIFALMIVPAIWMKIDSYGGWPIFWDDVKHWFRRKVR